MEACEGELGGDAFRLLFDAVPRSIFAFDRASLAFVAVNEAACEHYGWTRAELLGMNLRDIRPSEDVPYFELVIDTAGGRPESRFSYPARHRTKDGRILDVEVEIARVSLDGRAVSLAVVTDLTGVAGIERRFRLLVENSADGIVVVAPGGTFTYVSPGAARLIGVPADQLVGRSASAMSAPEDVAAILALPPNETTVLVSQVRHGDGSLRWLESSITNLTLDPVIRGYVTNFRDVTARKDAEAVLGRMVVADRMLSVGTLAAGVAHEVNNPLAYVATNLELLAHELPQLLAGTSRLGPDQILALLADAREGASRVSAIVRDLRDLAKPDDHTLSSICVAEVLAFAIKMAHHELRHRATVVVDHAAGLPLILANASRLGQVFLNLLINAAQAIPEGRAESNQIRIRAYPADEGRSVCVAITDTGSGIPPAIQGRIFDPFFTTKPIGDGMGLGLAISHQIVRSIGGDIAVASTPGAGSTFTVTLPAAIGEATEPAAEHAPAGDLPARILLIDDEPAIGRAVQLLLEPDHAVVIETCARAALARLRDGEEFDAILCDLMMPEISGMEFYAQLGRLAPNHLDRVVFVTGGAFTPAARKFLGTVALPSLDKPFTETALRCAVAAARR